MYTIYIVVLNVIKSLSSALSNITRSKYISFFTSQ